jgi:hypothetical protein
MDDLDELRHALGAVVLESAYLERVLRAAFSALVGSKYAALVDARLSTAALIEDCERISRHRGDISDPDRDGLLDALKACHEANADRNRVIHEVWAPQPAVAMVMPDGSRHSRHVMVTARTPAEAQQVADRVGVAAHGVKTAMTAALGPGWVHVEGQLRQEVGPDIGADPGQLLTRPHGKHLEFPHRFQRMLGDCVATACCW